MSAAAGSPARPRMRPSLRTESALSFGQESAMTQAHKGINRDTAPIPIAQILAQLEKGEVKVQRTPEGSRLETIPAPPPPVERRQARSDVPAPAVERRGLPPL